MTLKEIVARLEEAKGPNRWIDAKIDAARRVGSAKMNTAGYEWVWQNFPTWAAHKQARGMCGVQHDNGDLGLIWDSPEFTGSVDAAIALAERVLPGWFRSHTTGLGHTAAYIRNSSILDPNKIEGEGYHAVEAISLCIAILKALTSNPLNGDGVLTEGGERA